MNLSNMRTGTGRVIPFIFALGAVFIAWGFAAHADEAAVWRKYAAGMKSEAAQTREVAAGVASGLARADMENEIVSSLTAKAKTYLRRGDDFTAAADRAMEAEKYERAYRLYNTAKVYFMGSATAGLNAKSVLRGIEGPRNKPAGTENGKRYTTKEAVK